MSSKQISRITVARQGEVHPGVNYDVHVRIPALAAVPWGLVLAYDVLGPLRSIYLESTVSPTEPARTLEPPGRNRLG